jgi:hypothetical protein
MFSSPFRVFLFLTVYISASAADRTVKEVSSTDGPGRLFRAGTAALPASGRAGTASSPPKQFTQPGVVLRAGTASSPCQLG